MGAEIKTNLINVTDATKEAINYLTPPGSIASEDRGAAPTVQAIFNGNDDPHTKLLLDSEVFPFVDTAAGNASPLTITNSSATQSVTSKWSSGAIYFDGTAKVSAPTPDITSGDWSIDWWFRIDTSQASNHWMVNQDTDGNGDWAFGINTNQIYLHERGGVVTLGPTVTQGIYHHCKLVKSGTNFKAFYDGVSFATNANFNTLATLYIGQHPAGILPYTGLIDELRVQLLTTQEALALYGSSTISLPTVPYALATTGWSTSTIEETSPSLDNSMFGKNASNEPIEISTANGRKSVVYDIGNTSGGVSIDYVTNPATLYIATATAAITGWTFTNFPTNFPFKLHVTGNFDTAYGTDGAGSFANQDGLKVFNVEYDGTNYQMTFENSAGGSAINPQVGTAYTLVLSDANNGVTMDNPAANAVTIPLNSSVPFPIGNITPIDQIGVGATTITGVAGVIINGVDGGSETITAQYLGACPKQIALNTWLVQGGI